MKQIGLIIIFCALIIYIKWIFAPRIMSKGLKLIEAIENTQLKFEDIENNLAVGLAMVTEAMVTEVVPGVNQTTKSEFLQKILNESKTESCLIPDLLAENYDSETMQNYQPILSINHHYEQQEKYNCHKRYKEKYPKFTVYHPNNRTISIHA